MKKFKKYVLYFLTSFASIWFMRQFLSGFRIVGEAYNVLLFAIFITLAVYLTDMIVKKAASSKAWIYLLLNTLVGFFVLYISTLILEGVKVTAGSLKTFNLEFLTTPTVNRLDMILTLLIAAFITALVARLTKWASK
jgi:hypothetical protein